MQYWESVKALESEVIELRQMLHQIPEEGLAEVKTSAAIEAYLKKLKLDSLSRTAETGWIAFFKGNNPKKTIAFRTDIDGLSIKEATGLAFESKHEGMMHACGHDGHMAIALAFSKWISDHKNHLEDNIVVIFQPAEEGPGGAEIIVDEGALAAYDIDAIFGLHLFPELAEGTFGVKEGPIMAMTDEFDIDVYGKSAHGAKPHLGTDSIVIAANMLQNLQQIVSRNINPVEPVVLTVGKIEGGERRNIIAGKTRLEGTIRGFNIEVFDTVEQEIQKIAAMYEQVYGCKIDYEFRRLYPPVMNDPKLTQDFINLVGDEVEIVAPQMLAEDFSYFNKMAPCLFFFLGTRNEEKDFVYGLHHEKFNFTESVLLKAVQVYVGLLKQYASISDL